MNFFFVYLIALIFFGVLDYLWLGLSGNARNYYLPMHRDIQGSEVEFRMVSATIAYLLLALGVAYFLVDAEKDYCTIILNGIVLGLVVYGVYNGTNHALFKNFRTDMAIKDTVWGMTVFPLTAVLTKYTISLLE